MVARKLYRRLNTFGRGLRQKQCVRIGAGGGIPRDQDQKQRRGKRYFNGETKMRHSLGHLTVFGKKEAEGCTEGGSGRRKGGTGCLNEEGEKKSL